ncbi:MAG: class I SAM-dependent methyltransferase [Candidatus Hodarchaeota archaeon]
MKDIRHGHPLIRPLYGFLLHCNASSLEKVILDLGAGGERPPLSIFYQHGYKTYGIEISDNEVEKALQFGKKANIELNIIKGDMRKIPFVNEVMSFVYSINAMCLLSKKGMIITLKEIERVLRPNGLCFVNFISIDDKMYGAGREIRKGEFLLEGKMWLEEEVINSFFEDDEPDQYFTNFEIIHKEKRIIEIPRKDWQIASIDYIVKKRPHGDYNGKT